MYRRRKNFISIIIIITFIIVNNVYIKYINNNEEERIKFVYIDAGYSHSAAVSENGYVWTWGANYNGQLGNGRKEASLLPVQIKSLTKVKMISAGDNHTISLKNDGTVWSWGSNRYGQLGIGSIKDSNKPKKVAGLENTVMVACGNGFSMALKADGSVWSWGYNNAGQLGDASTENKNIPVQVVGINNIKCISAGKNHALALRNDGVLFAWGNNNAGQLGDGTRETSIIPKQVSNFGSEIIKKIAAGSNHSIAITTDGDLWTWGANGNGQLGKGNTKHSLLPEKVSSLNKIIDIACGYSYSIALKSDGTVWAWGGATLLGDSTTIASSNPIEIKSLKNIKQISSKYRHSLALDIEGFIWAWGTNKQGNIGDGTTVDKDIPVKSLHTTSAQDNLEATVRYLGHRVANKEEQILINNMIYLYIDNISKLLGITIDVTQDNDIILKRGVYSTKSKIIDKNKIPMDELNKQTMGIKINNKLYFPLYELEKLGFKISFEERNNTYYIKNNTVKNVTNYKNSYQNYYSLWWSFNTGSNINGIDGVEGVDINILQVKNITTGDKNVIVGIIDTGIDINHKTLSKGVYFNSEEIPNDGIDNDGNGYIDDVYGWDFVNNDNSVYDSSYIDKHGTSIAGIILGIAPNISILPLKAFSNYVGYASDIVTAVDYSEKMGVAIANCSFSEPYYNYSLKDSIKSSQILFVSAAGNKGFNAKNSNFYPGSFDLKNIISVAAITNDGLLLPTSNYGMHIDLAAPGFHIFSTIPNNEYDYFYGTSIATPFVTGTAALIKSQFPYKSSEEIRYTIISNARKMSTLSKKVKSEGIINVYDSLTNNRK